MKENGWKAQPVPTYNVAVILAEPADVSHESTPITAQPCKLLPEKTYADGYDKEYYQDLVYCVTDYYKENSFGTVNLDFTIYDNDGKWFKVSEEGDFIEKAIDLIRSKGIDLSVYGATIIVKAKERGNSFHIVEINEDTGEIIDFSKIKVGEKDSVGVWSHEIGHFIGAFITPRNTAAPDLYGIGNVEKWDVMAQGACDLIILGSCITYTDNPSSISSFTKEFLGWLNYDIHPKSAYGEHWIDSLTTRNYGDSVFRYNLSGDTNEDSPRYYILEARNRNLGTWDTSLPGLPEIDDKNLVLYYIDTNGIPKYGYDLENKKKMVESWTVTIPGNSPSSLLEINDGILNPLFNETYRDLDNLVKFSAITDRTVNDKYEIQARIEEITNDSFGDKFWGVILRPGSIFKGRIKGIFYSKAPSNTPTSYMTEFTSNQLKSELTEVVFDQKAQEGKSERKQLSLLAPPLLFQTFPKEFFVNLSNFIFWSILLPLFLLIFLLFCLSKISFIRKSEKKEKRVKLFLKFFWILVIVFSIIALFSFTFSFTRQSVYEHEGVQIRFRKEAPPLQPTTFPDLDLHLYCDDGRHIGMNYETEEYEIQIPEAIVSGDNQDAPEWILIPPDITGCHFVVSSYDNQKFLEENPDIAQEMEDTTDGYEVYARYVDPETDIYTSTIIAEDIEPGAELEHKISGAHDIAIQSGVLIARINFDPDTLNLKSKGEVVTAYVELPRGFDISQIDISSILLNGSVPALSDPIEIEDYNSNGIPDLMVKFNREEVQNVLNAKEEISITITGLIFHNNNYLEFKGNDTIKAIDNGMKMAIKKGN